MSDHHTSAGEDADRKLLERVEKSLREMQEAGERVTFYATATRAQVARSTLYRRDDLRKLVDRARTGTAMQADHRAARHYSSHAEPIRAATTLDMPPNNDSISYDASIQNRISLLESQLEQIARETASLSALQIHMPLQTYASVLLSPAYTPANKRCDH